MVKSYSYNIFFDFIESYLPAGFLNINPDDPIMMKLEELMEENDQYLQIVDMGKMKFIFTSKGIVKQYGILPEEFDPGIYLKFIHPDDEVLLGQGRAQVYKMENTITKAQKGSLLISYCLRSLTANGVYSNMLVQDYLFFTPIPYKMVFLIQVITNVSDRKMKNNHFHYYYGDDPSFFRFPDENLLNIGMPYSKRELEIIRLIESGLSSKEIADKIFLSVHTVNTHRSNILEKSGKFQISDLIYELKEKGVL